MSLYLGCREEDEGSIDTELQSGLCSGLGRLDKCDNNPGGDEEGLNKAEVVEPKKTQWVREVI